MKKVQKVMMFMHRTGKPDSFFVVHRVNRDDYVIPTGHVEANETLEQSARREVEEEIGVRPIRVLETGYTVVSILEEGAKQSTETAFLIEIPDQEVQFLEQSKDGTPDGVGSWILREDLANVLSYAGQVNAVDSLPAF